jgi:hypothetical protein
MRFFLAIALSTVPVLSQSSLCEGLVLQDAGPSAAQASIQTAAVHPANEETVLLHKGTEVCLHPSQTLSTQASKQGERVAFQLDNDVFAEGTVVAPRGAKISATIAELKKPGRGDRDGVLALAFDPLRLANGQQVTLVPRHRPNPSLQHKGSGLEYYLMAGPLLPLVPFVIPFSKGMDVTLLENQCVNYEVAQDVPVNKTEILSKQPQDNSWKQRFREIVLRVHQQDQHVPSLAIAPAKPEFGNEILGFDVTNGRERRLAECRQCYSPVTCPDCFRVKSDYWRILYLQADGIYSTIAHPEKDLKYLGYDRIFQGSFSRIMGVMGSYLVVADSTPSSCKLVLFGTASGPAYWMDELACDEIAPGYAQEVRTGVSTVQWLEGQWVGNLESQPQGRKSIFFSDKAGTRTTLPDSPLYDRFDPAWIDLSHIIYAGNKISRSKTH